MKMKVNSNTVTKLRNDRAWSQQQLADVSSISLRTIQRVEKMGVASQDTVQAIASAFSIAPSELILNSENVRKSRTNHVRGIVAVMAIAVVSIIYTTVSFAEPIMLHVQALSDENEIANVRILNGAGKESEIRIDSALKVYFESDETEEKQVRIQLKIYESTQNGEYEIIASPAVITGYNVPATVITDGKNGKKYQIAVTPKI